jgi:hypothetical protein
MTLKARLLLYMLCGGMIGFWLSVAAVLAVVASNGLGAMPRVLELLVHLAYWPARLSGTPPEGYFQPHLLWPVVVNIVGWTASGAIGGAIHQSIVGRESKSAR